MRWARTRIFSHPESKPQENLPHCNFRNYPEPFASSPLPTSILYVSPSYGSTSQQCHTVNMYSHKHGDERLSSKMMGWGSCCPTNLGDLVYRTVFHFLSLSTHTSLLIHLPHPGLSPPLSSVRPVLSNTVSPLGVPKSHGTLGSCDRIPSPPLITSSVCSYYHAEQGPARVASVPSH